jgi:adenylate cyclase
VKCASCGTENPAGMRFCGGCAEPLMDSGPPAAPTVPSGDRAVGTLLTGERRLVTILFADVSGFTMLSERLDPEALRDLITACFDRLVPCIQRYGGTIEKFVGDEIMALFGAPTAHENDPERALRAALEMRHALTALNQEQHVPLAIHFGVNTGLVYAGGVGGGGRKDYSVMGDAVNVASRLKGLAKPGEIVVGADTNRQAGHHDVMQPNGRCDLAE